MAAFARKAILLFLTITLFAACGGGGGGAASPVSETPFSVASTSPANGATNVPLNATITAAFNMALMANTVSIATFSISSGVSGTVSYDAVNHVATFTPSSNLAYGTTYTATITTDVLSFTEKRLSADYAWSFTTGSAPDTTPPIVSSVTPTNNATGIAANTIITAVFSEAMKASTITASSFVLKDADNNAVTGSIGCNGNTATFTPSASLAYSTDYTAKITTAAQDLAGNAIASDYSWTFTTKPAPAAIYPRYAYVSNTGENKVWVYIVHNATGRLEYAGKTATGAWPSPVAVDPAGKYAYVANWTDSTVSQYTIGSDGLLTSMPTVSVPAGLNPIRVVVDPTGRYAYTANNGGNGTISQYTIGADGSLTHLGEKTLTASSMSGPSDIAVDPTGTYVYLTNRLTNTVEQFSIGDNGYLTNLVPPTVTVGAGITTPMSIALDPAGTHAYVVRYNDNILSQFAIDANGTLSAVADSDAYLGYHPVFITVDPAGKNAYIVNQGPSSSYIGQRTIGAEGVISVTGPTATFSDVTTTSVTVDPSGKYLFAANGGSGTIGQYIIASDGTFTANSQPSVPIPGGPSRIVITSGNQPL